MPREPRLWQFRVRDILDAIARIQTYAADMTFEQFAADRKTLDAIERNFISIGEAARDFPDEVIKEHPEVPWGDMRAMRNFVVHVYWGVDPQRVWDTIHTNLPPLVPQLEKVLQSAEGSKGT